MFSFDIPLFYYDIFMADALTILIQDTSIITGNLPFRTIILKNQGRSKISDLPIYNIFIYFIVHKFSSIHFWTSFSLILTRRAIVFTSMPSSAMERAVSFAFLSSPFSMPRFSPLSIHGQAGTRRMIFLQMSRKKCSTSARNISRQMIR